MLKVVNVALPETVGGSADLTPSNSTKTPDLKDVAPGQYAGRYIRYGIREHGMACAMNGIALHSGLIPYSGTFLVFSDYARPAMRLSALMGLRVIYVMTHDSIGLGEDGPTHQPVEHLAALRAIPGLIVFRPADAVETAEAWEIALERHGPSVLSLTRQNLSHVHPGPASENRTRRGAYRVVEASGPAQVAIFASGSEVEIAVAAAATLSADGIAVEVVSVPAMDLFHELSRQEQDALIGIAPVKVAVEAAIRQPWDWIIGRDGIFVGMTGFGASGPYQELYKYFGITAEAVVAQVRERLGRNF